MLELSVVLAASDASCQRIEAPIGGVRMDEVLSMINWGRIRDYALMLIALCGAVGLGVIAWRSTQSPAATCVAVIGGAMIVYIAAWLLCEAMAMTLFGALRSRKNDPPPLSLEDTSGGGDVMQYLRPWLVEASKQKHGHDCITIHRSAGMPVFPDTTNIPTFDELVRTLRRRMIPTHQFDRIRRKRGKQKRRRQTRRGLIPCNTFGRDIDLRVTITPSGPRQRVTLLTIESRRFIAPLRRAAAVRV